MMRGIPTVDQVAADTMDGLSIEAIMEKYDVSWQTVVNRRKDAGLNGRLSISRSRENSQSRFTHRPIHNVAIMDITGQAAAIEGRALFPSTVRDDWSRILISGINQAKIGKVITKGRWKGFPIYTLTLEERATCPRSCQHWGDCYGNRMRWSRRHRYGPEFEHRLWGELVDLQRKHLQGFAVRLHVLGDFYSVDYVRLWSRALREFSGLRVFGFTARWADEIGLALRNLAQRYPLKFAIRFSDAPVDEMSTISLHRGQDASAAAIQCPQQVGKTLACATCALCWQSRRPIAFIRH